MEAFVYGESDPPESREDIYGTDPIVIQINASVRSTQHTYTGRRSTKCAYGQSSGSNHDATLRAKATCKNLTASRHRRNELEFARECVKAVRAGGSLPQEPSPTVGGLFIS